MALAEHRHFRRAADSCHVSQPTLSGQIRKLEDELGVMLLERTSRKVLFTRAGLLLVDQARTVLREVKVLKEMASQQGETMSGPLHIGLIPTVGPYLLPHIIPMLHQTFPKLEMYLHEAQTHQLLAQLDSGKLDCVILALVKESEAFIEVPYLMSLCCWRSMKIIRGQTVTVYRCPIWRVKTADAGRWPLPARSGDGFLL